MNKKELDFQTKLFYTGKVFKYAGKNIAYNLLCQIPFFRFFDDYMIKPLNYADEKLKNESDTFKQLLNRREKKNREKSFDYQLEDDNIKSLKELIKHIKEKEDREM